MRGKVGFVLGVAVGYVLGTRAGRARYEQIKRGAISVWETSAVQQGVGAVKASLGSRVDEVKAAAGRAAKGLFSAAVQPRKTDAAGPATPPTNTATTSGSSKAADE